MEKQQVESKDKYNEEQSSLMEQSLEVKHSKEIEWSSEKYFSSGKEGSRGNECCSASKSNRGKSLMSSLRPSDT